jgi:hypothetical protein
VERVRGIDGDMNFKLTPSLTLIGSACYRDARVVESSNAALVNTRKVIVPSTTGSIYVGPGLGLSLGRQINASYSLAFR